MTADRFYRNPKFRSLALAVTVVALVTLLWQSDEPATPIDATTLRGEAEPDSFVTGGQFLSFGKSGQLMSRFESQRVEQFESEKLTRMQNPSAVVYGKNGETSWQAQADEGRFLQAEEIAHLTGNVLVTRETVDQPPLTLSTDKLTLNNSDRTIYTDTGVEISDALGITRAKGMKAWIDDRILELNDQVEGRYEPAN